MPTVAAASGESGKEGEPPVVADTPPFRTIDSLFDVIQDAINSEVNQLSVSYDGELGYPTDVEIDYMSNSIDAEYIVAANAYSPH